MREQYILQPTESSPGTENSSPTEAKNGSVEWRHSSCWQYVENHDYGLGIISEYSKHGKLVLSSDLIKGKAYCQQLKCHPLHTAILAVLYELG